MTPCPRTWFSTEFHTGKGLLRARLNDLLAAPRRRGVLPILLTLLCVGTFGTMVACGPAAEEAFSCTIGRRDIDTNHHVNNLHYLDYALEALPQAVFDCLPGTLEIVYRKQILLGTPIRCLYQSTDEGRHQVEIRSGPEEDPVHHAFLWFY